jgi:hypothetical protein
VSDFFCDLLGWGCEQHGEYVTHAAPEISSGALLLGVALVVGVVAIVVDHEWKRGRR